MAEPLPAIVLGFALVDIGRLAENRFAKDHKRDGIEIHEFRDFCDSEIRPLVVNVLNRLSDVGDVGDLVAPHGGWHGSHFTPIRFTLRLPLSLQKTARWELASEPDVWAR